MTIAALTMASTRGAECLIEAEFEKRVLVRIGHEIDAAAVASVAAAGPASRHELLPPEGNTAMSAIAGPYGDFGFVDEHWDLATKGTKSTKCLTPFCAFCG